MADPQSTTSDDQTLIIPDDVRAQFPDLVELIQGSKSMNNEERQYWIDVLPIMSEEQLANLRGILDNEKKQLAEAAEAYAAKSAAAEEKAKRAFDEAAYLEQKRLRREEEAKHEQEEQEDEAAILAEISQL